MKPKHLIGQHLEHVTRAALEKYPTILRSFVRRRDGIYVLYQRDHLYYVGLAKNLHSRLKHHLKDRHGESWDSLSVYFTVGNVPLRELESLLIRVADPDGNKQRGRFLKSEDLTRSFNRTVRKYFQAEGDALTGKVRAKAVSEKETGEQKPILFGYEFRRRKLRANYKGKTFDARVLRDGRISYRGKRYSAPSAVASFIAGRNMNGWSFWMIERAPGDWVSLDWLRREK
jgi:hypothetical protein